MARIRGVARHLRRLNFLRRETAQEVARELYAVGQQIEADAELSIVSGSISGANHIPSAPGEPPNADTRHLDGNIETELPQGTKSPTVTVTSYAEYSAALEYGTEKMDERPFMRPALEKNKKNVRKAGRRGVNATLRRSGR